MVWRGACALAGAAMLLAACGGDDTPPRADVVGAMTDEDVPDRYAALASAAAAVATEVDELCAGGSTTTDELMVGVAEARAQWLGLAPFWFGPVAEHRSRFVVDWVVDPAEVEERVTGTAPVDATSLRELAGADQRGLGAIEVLLVAGPATPEERRCDYARGNAELVAGEAALLAEEWVEFGPGLSDGEEAANDALAEIASESLFSLDMAAKETTLDAARARVAGIRWVMLGELSSPAEDRADEKSAGALDAGISPLLDDEVVEVLFAEFGAVEEALDAEPLDEAVLMESLVELERTVATNVVGELGITVKFSDADGDG